MELPRRYAVMLNVLEAGYLMGMIAKLKPEDGDLLADVREQLEEIWKDTYNKPNNAMILEADKGA